MLRPTVAEMARRGTPFSGLLYAGLALTSAVFGWSSSMPGSAIPKLSHCWLVCDSSRWTSLRCGYG